MQLMEDVLERLTQLLRRSKKEFSWTTGLASLLILAMANESIQVNLRCKEATNKEEGVLDLHDETVRRESTMIDEIFTFLRDLYHRGYKTEGTKARPSFNPIQNVDDREKLEGPARNLAQSVKEVLESHRKFFIVIYYIEFLTEVGDFLESRQWLGLPTATEPNTSRLVARYLLSF